MPQTDASADARAARAALELQPGIEALDLPAGYFDRVERFVSLLLATNARLNLTRVVAPDAVATFHLLDSLAALPIIDAARPRRALDVGSGGGVPGIVLALARPGISWTLLDATRRKADALRTFVEALGLANVSVIAERAEVLGRDPDQRESSDLVTARACAALPVLAEYALPLASVGGALLAWKGPITASELEAGRAASEILGGGEASLRPTGFEALGDHQFVLVPKVRHTPEGYPRRAGEPSRRPLG